MTNSYTDYSLEELISMRKSIDAEIGKKQKQAYNEALGNVLKALKVMADKYPCEDVYETDDYDYDYMTWQDLYSRILDNA